MGIRRGRGLLLGGIAALALAGAVSGAGAHGKVAVSMPARSLVSMRLDNSQTFETVAVETNGAGEVGIFIGETTGIRYRSFMLRSNRLAKLRAEIAAADKLPHDVYLGNLSSSLPYVNTLQYLISTAHRSFDTSSGHVPPRLKGLVADLSGLIMRYEQAASRSSRTKPRFGEH